jgi:hypothetical protein
MDPQIINICWLQSTTCNKYKSSPGDRLMITKILYLKKEENWPKYSNPDLVNSFYPIVVQF